MLQDVHYADAALGVFDKDHPQQGFACWVQVRRKINVFVDLCREKRYNLGQLFVLAEPEGDPSGDKLEHHDPQGPDVDLLVVTAAHQQLWGYVKRRPAEGIPAIAGRVHRPAEISHLGQSESQDYVLRLEISVDDVVQMEGEDAFTDSLHNGHPLLVLQFALHLEDVIKLAARAVLHDQIDIGLIGKCSV
jgi:hypothetical protein